MGEFPRRGGKKSNGNQEIFMGFSSRGIRLGDLPEAPHLKVGGDVCGTGEAGGSKQRRPGCLIAPSLEQSLAWQEMGMR